MTIHRSIQRHEMPAHTLLWNFVWRSSLWGSGTGAMLGLLYGFFVATLWTLSEAPGHENQLNLFSTITAIFMLGAIAAIVGAIIGALLGLLLGLANGLIIGIVTLLLSATQVDIQQSLEVMRFISVIVTMIGAAVGLHLTIMRQTDYALIYMILPAIVAGVGAWWASGQIVKWYAEELDRSYDMDYRAA